MAQIISVVNQSEVVSNHDVARILNAVLHQLRKHVAPIYGLVPMLMMDTQSLRKTDGIMQCFIQDEPDVDNALGYHDDSDGVPYIKVFSSPILRNDGTILNGPNSLSVTLSHEVLELVGDPAANGWHDGPDGYDYARELCDAVEGDSYEIDGVSVSNFLYPAFFDPKAKVKGWKFDYLNRLTQPFGMTPGGYQIRRKEIKDPSQVFAALPQIFDVAPIDSSALTDDSIVPIIDPVTAVFGDRFPDWKVPYKARKIAKRSKRSRPR